MLTQADTGGGGSELSRAESLILSNGSRSEKSSILSSQFWAQSSVHSSWFRTKIGGGVESNFSVQFWSEDCY